MKKLNIELRENGKKIVFCKTLEMDRLGDGTFELRFNQGIMNFQEEEREQLPLEIVITFEGEWLTQFEVPCTIEIDNKRTVFSDLKINLGKKPFKKISFENWSIFKILQLWDNHISTQWWELEMAERKFWPSTCLIWQGGLCKKIQLGEAFFIEGGNVKQVSDFFCSIGHALVGYRGYFGQDFHGLKDCISELGKIGVHNSELIFKNTKNLELVLSKEFPNYFEEVVEVFKRNGFLVTLD